MDNTKNYLGSIDRDLVLRTFGSVWIQTGDVFRKVNFDQTSSDSDIIILDTNNEIEKYNDSYPGENKLIVTLDGHIYIAKNGKINEFSDSNDNSTFSQIVIENGPNQAPLVISNSVLVKNLNSELFSGKKITEFCLKSEEATIDAKRTYNKSVSFNDVISASKSMSNNVSGHGNATIDFENSILTIDTINCNNLNYSLQSKDEYAISIKIDSGFPEIKYTSLKGISVQKSIINSITVDYAIDVLIPNSISSSNSMVFITTCYEGVYHPTLMGYEWVNHELNYSTLRVYSYQLNDIIKNVNCDIFIKKIL